MKEYGNKLFDVRTTVSGLGSPVLSHNINYGLLLKTTRAAKAERDGETEREGERETNKIKFEMKIKINRKRKKAFKRERGRGSGKSIHTFPYTIYHMPYIVCRIWYMVYRLCRHSSCFLFICMHLFIYCICLFKNAAHPPAQISGHGLGWVGRVAVIVTGSGPGQSSLYCVLDFI